MKKLAAKAVAGARVFAKAVADKIVLRDAAGLVGAGCFVRGVAEYSGPAGWMTAGAFLLAGAILSARKPA